MIRVGCFAHCRRYFFDAIPKDWKKQSKELPAEIRVAYCNRLFEIERELKDLSPEERKAERFVRERKVLDEFWSWLDTVEPLGGSRLAKAVTYARNQRESGRISAGRPL